MITSNYINNRTSEDAFILLLQKYKEGNGRNDELENLYQKTKEFIETIYNHETGQIYELTKEDFLKLILGNHSNLYINNIFKKNIVKIAYDTIGENGKKMLGNYAPIGEDGKIGFNSSSWICHVLQVAEFASDLAYCMGLNPDTAKKLGILHDIGRTQDHSFQHTTIGNKILKDIGWNDEAPICLTHSYLGGDYAANNELAPDGWKIDENGNNFWETDKKPQIAQWLENYQCNEYDLIIQLSDLLVEQRGKVDIQNRIEGIKSRRESKGIKLNDQPNRAYFLTTLYNLLINIMCQIDPDSKENIIKNFPYIDKIKTVEEIESLFYNGKNSLSTFFSNFYQQKIKVDQIENPKKDPKYDGNEIKD